MNITHTLTDDVIVCDDVPITADHKPSASDVSSGAGMEPKVCYSLFGGVVIPDQGGRLRELEQVGGRAHEAQFDFVWCGGSDDAYRDDSTNAVSRDAFHQRCWQLEVLQYSWN